MSEVISPTSDPEAEIDPIISDLSDFSDRVSPMMVKELRQGLRTRAFTLTFLILQVILGFSMLGAMFSTSSDTGRMISSMVFFLFSIVALILQPLRGVNSVAAELKDDTLEILSLTRLSTMRIVLGKWASLVSQTALMLAATIPYLVMRYFFGGMQLFAELALLGTVFYLSMCLTAVTVGFSCAKSTLLRGLVPLLLIPFGFMLVSSMVFGFQFLSMLRVFSFQDSEVIVAFLTFLVLCGYVGYYFLSMGVTRIAAVAENHSFRKRLVALVLMFAVLLVLFFNDPAQGASLYVILAFASLIGLDVCTEDAARVPNVVKPFVKRGAFGKLLGRFFYPGWHSGVFLLLVLLVFAIIIGELTVNRWHSYGSTGGLGIEEILIILGVFYTILAPLLIIRIFTEKFSDSFSAYVMMLILSGLLTVLVGIFADTSGGGSGFLMLTSWIPGVWLLFMESHDEEMGVVLTGVFLAGVFLLLSGRALVEFRETARLEKQAEDALQAED